jgi:ribosomal RNA methyltransferase Nop2
LCRKLAEEELKMNVADRDVFVFPSESELKEPLGLQEVQRRIKDVVAVLSDFNRLRSEDRYAILALRDLELYWNHVENTSEILCDCCAHVCVQQLAKCLN